MVLFGVFADASFMSPAALRFMPQPLRLGLRINPVLFPPRLLRPDIMERSVMKQAKRHRSFVTRLARQRARLCELEMMRLARCSTANKTGQGGNELEV
jgi:hypothetical protein